MLDDRGRPTPTGFRSQFAMRCLACDVKEAESRKEYQARYHRVRTGAINELIARHQREYDRLLVEMNEKVMAEMDQDDRVVAELDRRGANVKGPAKKAAAGVRRR